MTYLEHPDLPGRGIRVRESAVRVYRASGWLPVDEPVPEPKPEAKPRRRRAQQSEGDGPHGTDAA